MPEVQRDSEAPPADGVEITRTAGQHVQCSTTSVDVCEHLSPDQLDVGYQVILNISSGHVNTSGNFLPEMKYDVFVLKVTTAALS